jgi:hypothetical protein
VQGLGCLPAVDELERLGGHRVDHPLRLVAHPIEPGARRLPHTVHTALPPSPENPPRQHRKALCPPGCPPWTGKSLLYPGLWRGVCRRASTSPRAATRIPHSGDQRTRT